MAKQVITGDQSDSVPGTNVIDSRCVVEFRPDDGWGGEYGFDWFRIGDCKELNYTIKSGPDKGKTHPVEKTINGKNNGATHYIKDEIVGKYSVNNTDNVNGTPPDPDHPQLSGIFVHSKASKYSMADKLNNINKEYYWADKLVRYEYKFFEIIGSDRNYIVPWITLFYSSISKNPNVKMLPKKMTIKFSDGVRKDPIYKTQATVKLIINAKNIKRIEFKTIPHFLSISVDNKDGCNTIDNVPNTQDNAPNTQHKLTIRCNCRFDENPQSVKAFAIHNDGTRTFAGQINVECCTPRVLDVYFVNVKTKYDNVPSKGGLPDFDSILSQEDNLKKYLAQAHLISDIHYEELDLHWNNNTTNYQNNQYDSLRGKVYLVSGKDERGWIREGDGTNRERELGDKLEKMFNDKLKEMFGNETSKVNAYKIFFLDLPVFWNSAEADDTEKGSLAGKANKIVSKAAIIAMVPKISSTVCHELLHCFGLYHSFSNRGDFTYKKCMTSNIMDYQFLKVADEKKYNGLERVSLSLWQWRKIRKLFEDNEIDIKKENNLVRVTS